MAIGVIGWGSLIWAPQVLSIQSRWHSDGPMLPLEYARISSRDRLTLVISERDPPQRTYWAYSTHENLEYAVSELQVREGTKQIHFIVSGGIASEGCSINVHKTVYRWLADHPKLSGCIWTGLRSNWNEKHSRAFSVEDAVNYLAGLADTSAAKEYIQNTPSQVQTPLRSLVRQRLGWADADLSPDLFSDV